MSETNNLKTTVEALLKGVDGLVSSKTVVGDAVHVDNITVLPLIDVSFGIGAGSNLSDKTTRLVNIKNQDTITKLFDLVPEVLDKITTRKEDKVTEEDVADILDAAEELEKE